MKLQDFLKQLFSQPAVEGYEIGRLEIDVGIMGEDLVIGMDCPCAKIVITPNRIYIAIEKCVYRIENEKLVRLEFVEKKQGES